MSDQSSDAPAQSGDYTTARHSTQTQTTGEVAPDSANPQEESTASPSRHHSDRHEADHNALLSSLAQIESAREQLESTMREMKAFLWSARAAANGAARVHAGDAVSQTRLQEGSGGREPGADAAPPSVVTVSFTKDEIDYFAAQCHACFNNISECCTADSESNQTVKLVIMPMLELCLKLVAKVKVKAARDARK